MNANLTFNRRGADGYHLWKAVTQSFALAKQSSGSQAFSSVGYSFHLTRYWSFLRCKQESRTSSPSYSSSSPIRLGGGGGSFLWDSNAGGMYGFKRASLKTGCTFQDDGSLSSYEDSA